MASNEGNNVLSVLQKRFQQKNEFVGREGEELSCSPGPANIMYLRSCTSCKVHMRGKAAKCILEKCKDVTVELEDKVVSGMFEMINCSGVEVDINPQDKLPTITADNCENITIKCHQPQAIGTFYTVKCSNVEVCLDPPYKETIKLDLPGPEVEGQYLSEYVAGKMTTELVIREGVGYPTTASRKEKEDAKQELIRKQYEAYLNSIITIKEGRSKTSPPKKVPSPPKKVISPPRNPPKSGSASIVRAGKLRDMKGLLKPTETHVTHLPVVGTSPQPPKPKPFNPAIEDEEEKKEFFDKEEDLEAHVKTVAKWMKESKYTIMFTGAGISTSAGIPDFRSGMNTVLDTGPGVWELRDKKQGLTEKQKTDLKKKIRKGLVEALPSVTHMAILKLHEAGLVHLTVSQNVDGLHRRSNLNPKELAELHGNTNLEHCRKCKREYMRDFETREAFGVFDHRTSRMCDDPKCGDQLHDSIINFGENLPAKELGKAFDGSKKADMCIVLGSSLRVTPAADVPKEVARKGGKLVICNLQRTPLSSRASINVHAMCDAFMTKLMKELDLEIPEFKLHRRMKVSMKEMKKGTFEVVVTGLDVHEDAPYSFIKGILASGQGLSKVTEVEEEPFEFQLSAQAGSVAKLRLYFQGHYDEPYLDMEVPLKDGQTEVYNLKYKPGAAEWEVEKC